MTPKTEFTGGSNGTGGCIRNRSDAKGFGGDDGPEDVDVGWDCVGRWVGGLFLVLKQGASEGARWRSHGAGPIRLGHANHPDAGGARGLCVPAACECAVDAEPAVDYSGDIGSGKGVTDGVGAGRAGEE